MRILSQIDVIYHKVYRFVPGWFDTLWYEHICKPVADYEDAL